MISFSDAKLIKIDRGTLMVTYKISNNLCKRLHNTYGSPFSLIIDTERAPISKAIPARNIM